MKRSISLLLAVLTALLLFVPATVSAENGEEGSCAELGHDFSDVFTVDAEPTCATEGSVSRHCLRCGEKTDITPIQKKEHTYGKWATRKAATCIEDGIEEQICSFCGYENTRVLPADGVHDIVTDEGIEPTCTKPGRTEGSHCSVCGKVITECEKIPELGHSLVTDEAVAPTCTKDGLTAGEHCSVCGLVTRKQNVIVHSGHKTVIDEAVEPTCTEDGFTRGSHCAVCGEILEPQNIIPKKNHAYEKTVVKRTCVEDGYILYVCKICNDGYIDNFDYAPGHKIVYDGEFIQKTCTTDGFQPKGYCSVCKEVIEDAEVLKATGHQWKTQLTRATRTKDGRILTTCSVCGETAPTGDVKIAKIASVKLSKNKFTYDGKAKKPAVVVTDSSGKVLTAKKDYTLTYDSGRKKVGAYYVSVNFKGNYSGRKALKFNIVLAKPAGIKVSSGYKAAAVSWDKVNGAKKYAVYYSTAKNGAYKKAGTTTKLKYDIARLQSSKTYYIKVRAVTKSVSGSNSYSSYSSVKKVKVR